jgi:AP-2 complex subunit alpha
MRRGLLLLQSALSVDTGQAAQAATVLPAPWYVGSKITCWAFADWCSEDSHVRKLIREALQKIMDSALEMPKNVQQNNAQNAVLFEAINLVIHLDTEQDLMVQISTRLGKFIASRETNVRYLGLEAMTHLAARAETLDPIKKHQSIIIGSLRDRDISVRRQGLDLLYSMCDQTNAQAIVQELLRYLQSADYAIREEMVLKIAILTEKYATDVQWYVDISLRLIAMAGDHVSDEVWQRVIQIVTNNEELQVYAAQNILQYVKSDCHETLVKIGGYLLGEFGHLIADTKGCSPIEQFMALNGKLRGCPSSTRAIILSSFVKFVNLFPEIKPQLLQTFRNYSHSLDSELQQRACEYLALASMPTDDLLRTVCDEMPPFPERTSALLSRLHQKHATTSDKRTWVIGGKDANTDPKEFNLVNQPTGLKRSFTNATPRDNGTSNGNGTNGVNAVANDLAGLDFNVDTNKVLKAPNLASAAHLSPDWDIGYYRLLLRTEGVLYEDAQIQIGLRTEYRGQLGCLIFYFTNRSAFPMDSFTTTLDNTAAESLKTDIKGLPDTVIPPEGQTQQTIMFEAKNVFADPPTFRVSYLAGALQALTLQLPVYIHKYMDAAELSGDDFFKRWKQIGGAPREAQRIFGLNNKNRSMDIDFVKRVVRGFKWGILEGLDPNSKNIVGATVLHTTEGKFGCLLRLEPNFDTQVSFECTH